MQSSGNFSTGFPNNFEQVIISEDVDEHNESIVKE